MAGANYMGGKRNAAKARSKDTTKRTQKNFFGHQRLNILARDFKHSPAGDPQPKGKSKIGLAHAKRNLEALPLPNVASSNRRNSDSVDPEPPGVIDRPESRSDEDSNKRPVSQVLDALDTSEPTFLRAKLDRILAMTDLAGLSKIRKAQASSAAASASAKRPRFRVSSPSPRRGKRQKVDSEHSENSDVFVSHHVSDRATPGDRVPSDVEGPGPSSESVSRQLVHGHALYNTGDESYLAYDEFNSMDLDESSTFRLSGFSDFEAGDDIVCNQGAVGRVSRLGEQLPSPSPSPVAHYRLVTPKPTEDVILNFDSSLSGTSSSSLGLSIPQIPESLIFYRDVHRGTLSATTIPRNLSLQTPSPSFLSLGETGAQSVTPALPVEDEPRPGYAFNQPYSPNHLTDGTGTWWNLFDEENPWEAVGKILGFESDRPSSYSDPVKGTHDRAGVGYVTPSGLEEAIDGEAKLSLLCTPDGAAPSSDKVDEPLASKRENELPETGCIDDIPREGTSAENLTRPESPIGTQTEIFRIGPLFSGCDSSDDDAE